MTRPTRTTRRTARKTELGPRAFLLAGLGAVSLGRKQARKSLDGLAALPSELRQRADAAAIDAGRRASRLGRKAEARLVPVQKQVARLATQARTTIEAGLAPVLARLGVGRKRAAAKRPARAAKRPARNAKPKARAAKRPAAKRSGKRA